MSVDTYDCDCCKETGVCSGCINKDGQIQKEHCPFCSGDKVSDSQRLDFLLGYLNLIADRFYIPKITIEDIDKDIIDKRKTK